MGFSCKEVCGLYFPSGSSSQILRNVWDVGKQTKETKILLQILDTGWNWEERWRHPPPLTENVSLRAGEQFKDVHGQRLLWVPPICGICGDRRPWETGTPTKIDLRKWSVWLFFKLDPFLLFGAYPLLDGFCVQPCHILGYRSLVEIPLFRGRKNEQLGKSKWTLFSSQALLLHFPERRSEGPKQKKAHDCGWLHAKKLPLVVLHVRMSVLLGQVRKPMQAAALAL